MVTWGESACFIYRWPCLKAVQMPTDRLFGKGGRQRKKMTGDWQKLKEEGLWSCTVSVVVQRKCTVIHYLVMPVLVFYIKEYGWLKNSGWRRDGLAWTNPSLYAYSVGMTEGCRPYTLQSPARKLYSKCMQWWHIFNFHWRHIYVAWFMCATL